MQQLVFYGLDVHESVFIFSILKYLDLAVVMWMIHHK